MFPKNTDEERITHLKSDKAGLKKLFACRHPTLGLRVGSVGRCFFYIGEGSLAARALPLFDVSFFAGRTFIRDYCCNR